MNKSEQWDSLLHDIRSIMEKAGLQHTIKWGSDMYTYQEKHIVGVVPLKNYVALWFPKGVFLTDPDKVLTNSAGKGAKALRQWRLYATADLDEAKVIRYVKEAIDIEQRGLKVPVDRSGPPPLPPILKTTLEAEPNLKQAFEKLTPGRRKEYILYINEAKRETTRQNRIEKIKPTILKGKGLHDKYR